MKNALDSRGIVTSSTQCVETTCGDPDGITTVGGKFYSYRIQPRTIGIRVGTRF